MKPPCTACQGTGRKYEGWVVRPCGKCAGIGYVDKGVDTKND